MIEGASIFDTIGAAWEHERRLVSPLHPKVDLADAAASPASKIELHP